MKNIYFATVFLFCFSLLSYSQWQQLNTNTNTSVFTIKFFNANTGIIAGQDTVGKILRTTNGGVNWSLVLRTSTSERFLCSSFINDQTGWIGTYNSFVYKTTDAGITWVQVSGYLNIGQVNSISFINSSTGWAIGAIVGVTKTTNGGVNWFNVAPNFTGKAVYFINQNTGIISTDQYTLRKTTNGGNGFIEIYQLPLYNFIYDIFFINSQTGYAAGTRKLIMKTTNFGSNWFLVNVDAEGPPIENFYNICFVDENLGYAAGQYIWSDMHGTTIYGILRKTTNGGLNWSSISLNPLPYSMNDVYISEGQIGYTAGNSNSVFKSTNAGYIGLNNIASEIPNHFSLHQNYPNPFNPSTKIKFELPASVEASRWNVLLTIYDILGREVQTLVNNNLKPGVYEVDFDASSLSGGIYFYKLDAGDFTETKKMIVIK